MKLFLFLASRRGYAVLKRLVAERANIGGILCLIEDAHETPYHPLITEIAQANNIPIFYSDQIKSSHYAELLHQIKPDIAFAIGWRYLITKEAYDIPLKGTLIIHDSLLPAYRGFAPMNWAIINGETQTGVTLFYITEGVDSGPIIDQLAVDIQINDTAQMVDEKIIPLYEKIIVKNLTSLANGHVKTVPQDESRATYTCKRTPDDGEMDWRLKAIELHNLVRACTHPFPGAFTTLRGKKIFIWETMWIDEQNKYVGNIPGRVLGKRNGMIEVLTGQGILRVTRLQFADDIEKSANDFSMSVKDTFGR